MFNILQERVIPILENYLDSTNMRVFICIDFSDEVIKEVARIHDSIKKVKFTGKLTELGNLHLTLKFLGEINENKLEEVRKRIRGIKMEKIDAKLGKVGIFSIRGNPRIVWIKLEGKGIHELQKKIDEVLKDLFAEEERFMSHLTIARIKYVKDKKGFREYMENVSVRDVKFKINSFKIKVSELKPSGPIYTTLEEFSLGNTPPRDVIPKGEN